MNPESLLRGALALAVPIIVGARVWSARMRPFGPHERMNVRTVGARPLAFATDAAAFILTLEYLVAPGLFAFAYALKYPLWLQLPGLALLLAGVGLLLWAAVHLDRRQAEIGRGDRAPYPQSGPYRWVRHPVYAAVFAQYLGAGLLSSNWVLTFVVPLLYLGALSQMVPQEEVLIMDSLSDRAGSYIQQTGLLFPGTDLYAPRREAELDPEHEDRSE